MIPFSPTWGACQRMYFLSEYLQNNGFNVFVIHLKRDSETYIPKTLSFSSIPIEGKTLAKHSKQIGAIDESMNKLVLKEVIKPFIYQLNKSFMIFRKTIFNDLDPYQGILGDMLVKGSRKEILNIIKRENIKTVIISGPPFSLFDLIKYLKKNFGNLQIILDYRDPWNLWNGGNLLSRYNERVSLQLADKVVFVNEQIRNDTIKLFSIDEDKCSVVYNGYSEKDWLNVIGSHKKCNLYEDRIVISYIGSISFEKGSYRDLSIFWSAFTNFKFKDKILIRFIGSSFSSETIYLKESFKNAIEFIPQVTYEQSLNYMLDSDVLLLIHTDKKSAKYVTTGKLFDYLRSGKVIFGLTDGEECYFTNFIKEYHLGITSMNNEENILESLNLIYSYWEKGKLQCLRSNSNFIIEKYSRDYQNLEYLSIISNI